MSMYDHEDDPVEERMQDRWRRVSGDEYMKFDRVEAKLSRRADLHAFMRLDELFPEGGDCMDLICSAADDEYWLDVTDVQIESLTDDQIIELARCGVRYYGEGLCLFA